MEIADVVHELNEWAHTNFQDANPWECLLGMAEEIGELASVIHVINREDDIIDAMGDILIYSIDFARREGINWAALQQKAYYSINGLSKTSMLSQMMETHSGFLAILNQHFGKICHHWLKRHQGIRKNEDHDEEIPTQLMLVIRDIELYCLMKPRYHEVDGGAEQWDLHSILAVTASQVLKRDWTSEKLGGVCLCPTPEPEDCPVHAPELDEDMIHKAEDAAYDATRDAAMEEPHG